MFIKFFILTFLFCEIIIAQEIDGSEPNANFVSNLSAYDQSVAESTVTQKKIGKILVKGTKSDKGLSNGLKTGTKGVSLIGVKTGKKETSTSGIVTRVEGLKKGGKSVAGGNIGGTSKKSIAKGKFGKVRSSGFSKNYGSVKNFGLNRSFTFGKSSDKKVVGGRSSVRGKKMVLVKTVGTKGFKKGAKKSQTLSEAIIAAHNAAKGKAMSGLGLKKGLGVKSKTAKVVGTGGKVKG